VYSEILTIANGVNDETEFRQNGVVAVGVRYIFLRKAENGCYLARKGPNTLMIHPTKKALVILLTNAAANPGNVTTGAFVQSDLIKKNF